MPVQWRQGDVLFERLDQLPEAAVPRAGDVLFTGEGAERAHRVADLTTAAIFETPHALFVRVDAPTAVVHEEHRSITFEPGVYRVWRQREYWPGRASGVQD